MSRNRHFNRATIREWAPASGASQADLGDAEAHLVAAHRSVIAAAEVIASRPGFLSADVDRILRLKRDLGNLLFNIRAQPPALTGDATGFLDKKGGLETSGTRRESGR